MYPRMKMTSSRVLNSTAMLDAISGREKRDSVYVSRPLLIRCVTVEVTLCRISFLWSRDVARWFRWGLSVADPFVCPFLTSSALLPFPHPAHRTGRADWPQPARGEDSHHRRSHCL